jgi:hypothetical protein
MKIRQHFVSNSSSTSFICDVCGNIKSGWDMRHSDAEMRQCINGHTWCTSHDFFDFEVKKLTDDSEDDDDELAYEEQWYEVDPQYCPICTLTHIRDSDLLKYILKWSEKTRGIFEDAIKLEYKNWEDFKKEIQ